MKHLLTPALIILVLGLIAPSSEAVDVAGRAGLGFTTTKAPVGGRHWANERVGVDAGIGITTRDGGRNIDVALAGGVPIKVLNTADRANLNIRPGILFMDPGGASGSVIYLTAQLEFEVFATRDFCLRAAYGPAIRSISGGPTDLLTTGENLTSAGFFFYFE